MFKELEPSMTIFTKEDFTKQRRREIFATLSERERIEGCSPLKAIRRKCVECSGGSAELSARCTCFNCPLWDYRFGTNPYKQEEAYTPEELNNIKNRMDSLKA
jgi:hypothetical protein